jgi:hypothetical protein
MSVPNTGQNFDAAFEQLESAIRADFGPEAEVEVHIIPPNGDRYVIGQER